MRDPTLLQEPELRPFLPLLYVAWADGDLGHAERRMLHEKVLQQPWLKPRLREALALWLDPERPPDAESLANLHATLEHAADTLGPEALGSWLELAEAMAATDTSGRAEKLGLLASLRDVLGQEREVLALRAAHPPDLTFEQPPRFDVAELTRVLDGAHHATREEVRAFLRTPAHRPAYGMPKEQHRELVQTWMKELAALGFGELAFPGVTGEARDLGAFFAAFETLGLGDLSLFVKFGVQFGLWGGSIYFLGTDAQRAEWLPRIARLEAPGCFAMSEVGHGSNVADLETVARYDPDTHELIVHTPSESARKDWAGNAAVYARWGTVFVQLEVAGVRHGVHAVIVPLRDETGATLPGVRIGDCGHKLGLNGVDNGRIWFEHVRVPADALLGRHARITPEGRYESPIESPARRFFTMLGTLVGGRVGVAAGSVSASKVGLAVALRYATHRRQFGPTSAPETLLLHYPTHQRRLLPGLAATYAYHFAAEGLRARFLTTPREADTRELEAQAAAIKAGASWHATQTLQACRETCGGQGYLGVNRIPDLRADADIFTTFEGDNVVLLQLVAKGLLTGFRQQFSRGGPSAWIRYLAGRAVTVVTEKNPLATRKADAETLRSSDFQRACLRYREDSLLSSAALRVQARAGRHDDGQALLEVQEHLVALALAHVDRIVLDAFVEAEERTGGPVREVLTRLRALHGLHTLERHAGWFLEHGYFEAPRTRAIRREVPMLFRELLPDVLPLVDAFGIPDACLAAPIAFDDPAHPRW